MSETMKPITLASYSSSVNAREKAVVTGWGYVTVSSWLTVLDKPAFDAIT